MYYVFSPCNCAERIFEDHENLVENLLNWTRDSQNKLMFVERIEKYALFKNPQVRTVLFVFLDLNCTEHNIAHRQETWKRH